VSPPADQDIGCRNLRWALALLDGLHAGGLRTLVLSPGSRSTPVVLAAQRLEAAGRMALEPILDERSAAFFALGLARGSGRPVAVLATSGSAPAHWHPAVLEADLTGVPLVLLSADRPPRLRGWGANQTADQNRLFGPAVREFHDPGLPVDAPAALKAVRALGLRAGQVTLGPRPGPVHLNLPFDEPLVPSGDCPDPALPSPPSMVTGASAQPAVSGLDEPLESWPRGRGLIVCGPMTASPALPEALWHCAQALTLPVLVDPLSGLRAGPAPASRITGYDTLLRNAAAAAALRPDWVLRIGRAPVSKTLGQWLAGIPTLLVDPAGGWSDPSHDLVRRITARPEALLDALAVAGLTQADPHWAGAWSGADAAVHALASEHLAGSPWCEGHLIRTMLARMNDGDALLCANSLPIRQLDCWSGPVAARVCIHGNRGASGIDGQLSTLAGLDHAGVPCWGLLGDLSFCHDLSGLLLAGGLRRPAIVVNNGGGRIFDYLPQHGRPGFERLWATPVAPDLAGLARAFGLAHRRVTDAAGLAQALDAMAAGNTGGAGIVEAVIDADRSRSVHKDFWQRVAAAPRLTPERT
jgi:2-succinyl-5-enolpyruvyl-6-hydroxy-3-cyclohexene-1-carboxylate synthase